MPKSLILLSMTVCLLSIPLAHAGGCVSTSAALSTTETAPSQVEFDARFESNTALAILESRPSQALWNYLLSRQEQFRNKLILEFHTQFRKEQQKWAEDNQKLHAEDPLNIRHPLASWISYATVLDTVWVAARNAARGAVWGVAMDAARGAAWVAAWDVVWDVVQGTNWIVAWGAARGDAQDAAREAREWILLYLTQSRISDPTELGKISDALSELYFLAHMNVHGQASRKAVYRAAFNNIPKNLDLETMYQNIAQQTWRKPTLKKNPYIQGMRELFDWKRHHALVSFVMLESAFSSGDVATTAVQRAMREVGRYDGDRHISRPIAEFLLELADCPHPDVSLFSVEEEE